MENDWIKIGLPFGRVFTREFKEKDSFCKRELNKAGTLIWLKNGRKLLIGHVNGLGGVCDDCMKFDRDEVVVAYKIVYNVLNEEN